MVKRIEIQIIRNRIISLSYTATITPIEIIKIKIDQNPNHPIQKPHQIQIPIKTSLNLNLNLNLLPPQAHKSTKISKNASQKYSTSWISSPVVL